MQRKAVALLTILTLSFVALSVNIQFGHCAVTWTYNAGTGVATASGSGTTNFAALVAADTAGGWGKFTADATGTQIKCQGRITVGDGTNQINWTDTGLQVTFTSGAVYNNYVFVVLAPCRVTFGTGDTDNKIGKNGCNFIHLATSGTYNFGSQAPPEVDSHLFLYGCSFKTSGVGLNVRADKIYNCQFHNGIAVPNLYHTGEMYYSTSTTTYQGFQFYSGATVDKIYSFGNTNGIYFYGQSGTEFTVKNPVLINNSKTVYFDQITTAKNFYLINANTGNAAWSLTFNNANGATLYRQNEFDLCVLNGEITDFVEDANVTLTKNGNQIGTWLTNSSGQIDTQTLTYGYYNATGGDTIYEGDHPFELTITHDDWATYTSRFYVTQKTSLYVSMQEIDEATPNNAAMIWGLLALAGAFCFLILWRVRR